LQLAEQEGQRGTESPDFELACLEAYLALACTSTMSAHHGHQWQERAAETAELLEATHGAYWSRRAGQLLVATASASAITNVELLRRLADSLYLNGDFNQAIAAYEKAATQARSQSDSRAFELAYKAALVEQKLERYLSAAKRLRELAKSQAADPHARQAHLLAAWNSAQADTRITNAGLYEELLREHLAMWATSASADQARLWLGAVCESKQAWSEAKELYSAVSQESSHREKAAQGLVRCQRAQLNKK
jgi:hypothetical protein